MKIRGSDGKIIIYGFGVVWHANADSGGGDIFCYPDDEVSGENAGFSNHAQNLLSQSATKITLNAQTARELGGLPYVGLKWSNAELADVVSDERRIAVMHPVQTYKNAQKQTHYLVLIEKCLVDKQGNLLSLPMSVLLGADLYVFKQTSNGYQLVTRSSEDTDFNFAYGRLMLDLPSLAKNLKPVGSHVQAKVESYNARQVSEATLVIKENQFIVIKE